MKTIHRLFTSITLGVTLIGLLTLPSDVAWAEDRHDLDELLIETDADILLDQYRQLREEAFQLEKDLRFHTIALRHGLGSDQDRRKLEIAEEQLQVLREWTERTRHEILELHERLEGDEEEEEAEESDRDVEWEGEHGEHGHSHDIDREGEEEEEWEEHGGEHEHDVSQPLRQMQGRWIGQERGSEHRIILEIEGERMAIALPEEDGSFRGRLQVEQEEDWIAFDFAIEDGSDAEYEGKTLHGICRVEEDHLVMAAPEPGQPNRPRSFEAVDSVVILEFRRD